jgi:hypothetical protein
MKVIEILQADLAAWNSMVQSQLSDLCEFSTDAMRWYGTSSDSQMTEVDEYGLPAAQRIGNGYNIGFPLRSFQFAAGWTAKFLKTATPADLAQKQLDAQVAHKKMIQTQIQKALLKKANYTVRDFLVDNVDLPVKRLLNADGATIADGPNGTSFAGTHLHYQSTGTPTVQDYINTIDNVVEHGFGSGLRLYINRSNESVVSAYTGFVKNQPVYMQGFLSAAGISTAMLDETRLDDRHIGYLHGAEVWTKPWIPANYAFAFAAGDSRKPLVFRQRANAGMQGLQLVAHFDTHPLQADIFEAEFGLGAWERSNGAVLYVGNDTWADAV